MAKKIFVGNLDFRTTKEEVETLFAQAGKIEDVYLPNDRETGRPRGFAFVTFSSDEEAVAAITRFNGHEMSGRALRVNEAEDRPRTGGGARPGGGGGGYAGGGGFGAGGYGGGGGGFGGGGGDRDNYGGGGFGGGRGGGGNPNNNKGSRRNIRAKKRSL